MAESLGIAGEAMKIETTSVKKIRLSEIKNLDPVTVILEDIEKGKGKIIIECYGQSWASYWGGMGDRTLAEFFCSCDEHYLAKNLSTIKADVDDFEGFIIKAKAEIIKQRLSLDLSSESAREMFDDVSRIESINENQSLIELIFGCEWWYEIPSKPNHEYEYLCRIIKTVQEALK